MKCVDLFSGLGGFSQAFLDRGHEVIRYDINPRFKDVPNTITRDVLTLKIKEIQADIILASPECRCFSVAADHYHWPKGIPTEETEQQIVLVKKMVAMIKRANPRFWILENPVGRMRRVLGKPDKTTAWCAWGTPYKKPTDLWGVLPPIDWKLPFKWEPNTSGGAGNQSKIANDPYPRDPAKRAFIPYEFSMAVCLAAEGNSLQTTLTDRGAPGKEESKN